MASPERAITVMAFGGKHEVMSTICACAVKPVNDRDSKKRQTSNPNLVSGLSEPN